MVGKIPQRIEIAKSLGADTTVTLPTADNSDDDRNNNKNSIYRNNNAIKDILDFTNGLGVNFIMIATSNPAALEFALKIASKGSIINLFAGFRRGDLVSLDPNWLHYNQISITGSFSSNPSPARAPSNSSARCWERIPPCNRSPRISRSGQKATRSSSRRASAAWSRPACSVDSGGRTD